MTRGSLRFISYKATMAKEKECKRKLISYFPNPKNDILFQRNKN